MALEFSGLKYKKFDTAAYAFHLGELAPNIKKFRFYKNSSPDTINSEADGLARAIKSYGVPYLTELARYEKVLPFLKERGDMLGLYPQKVVSCLFRDGKEKEAVDHANFLLEKYKNSESMGEQQVCDFANRFISFVEGNQHVFLGLD